MYCSISGGGVDGGTPRSDDCEEIAEEIISEEIEEDDELSAAAAADDEEMPVMRSEASSAVSLHHCP